MYAETVSMARLRRDFPKTRENTRKNLTIFPFTWHPVWFQDPPQTLEIFMHLRHPDTNSGHITKLIQVKCHQAEVVTCLVFAQAVTFAEFLHQILPAVNLFIRRISLCDHFQGEPNLLSLRFLERFRNSFRQDPRLLKMKSLFSSPCA